MAERTFPAADAVLSEVLGWVEEEMEKADFSMKTIMQTTISVEEIFVNIAHYAYPGEEGEMQFAIDIDDKQMAIRFTDEGIPFDPLSMADPDISLAAEDRGIGGLGIFMVKKYMDNVTYAWEDGKNILTLYKNRE